MKKYLALFLAVVTVVTLSSCSWMFPVKTNPSPSPSEPVDTASPSPSPSPTQSAATVFLAAEPSAPEIGVYLKQNAPDLSKDDGDMLLERLLLAQQDISAVMNYRILGEVYLKALNETMGGILDAYKIPRISDAAVRDDFQKASDGLMTIVRYEETPVFEPDWKALSEIKDVFSTQAGSMIEYQSRLQGRYYTGETYKFDLLAADIFAVEDEIKKADEGFVLWQLKYLYLRQVGRMLYGPEGYFLELFASGDKQLTENIKNYAQTYAGSKFSAICAHMLEIQKEGMTALSVYIGDSIDLPPGDTKDLTKSKFSYSGAEVEIPQLSGLKDAAVTDKINAAISDYAKSLVKDGNKNQSVSYYVSYVNDRYINLCFLYSYRNDSDSDHYAEFYLTLNLETGESVSLDDLAEKPFAEYKDKLLQLMNGPDVPADLAEPISFLLDRGELIISVPSSDSDWPDYYAVTWNGLRTFMDITQLY